MSETIESFVAKLQAEGVEAGQEQAAKLQAEAETEAREIIARAEAEAEKVIADARREAENTLARSRTEVELAARDVALKLRAALNRALTGILAVTVEEQLSNAEFLKKLIEGVVSRYAVSDREGVASISISVPEELHGRLEDWITQRLQDANGAVGGNIDLQATLKQAGFEYRVASGTVEVTLESVVETLKELVGESLRGLLDSALEESVSGEREQ